MNVDVLILGRGIAGAVLAEVLRQRGLRVHVFDRKRAGNASMVAAGVVNPLVFYKFSLMKAAATLAGSVQEHSSLVLLGEDKITLLRRGKRNPFNP